MRLPHAEFAVVPEAKLTGYLLNPNHRDGHSKAVFLLRRGFRRDRPDELRQALLRLALIADMEEQPSEYGVKYYGSAHLECPNGSQPLFLTVWVLLDGSPPPRFVTGYPA